MLEAAIGENTAEDEPNAPPISIVNNCDDDLQKNGPSINANQARGMVCTIVITPTIVIMIPAIAEMTASMAPPIAEKMEP